MTARHLTLPLILAAVLALGSCDSGVDPGGSSIALHPESVVPDAERAAYLRVKSRRIDLRWDTLSTYVTVYVVEAQAQFFVPGPSTPTGIPAGTLFHNDTLVSDPGENFGHVYNHGYGVGDTMLVADGRLNTFRITGSSDIEAFQSSVSALQGLTAITSPTTSDTIDRSAGLTLRWNGGGADTAYIWINANGVFITRLVPDNGSYTFTPSELAAFPAGEVDITVSRFNYSTPPVVQPGVSGPRRVVVMAISEHVIQPILR